MFAVNMRDIIFNIARWWEKYLSKRSFIKYTCSWRVNLLYLIVVTLTEEILNGKLHFSVQYEHWTDEQKYFYVLNYIVTLLPLDTITITPINDLQFLRQ